MAARALMRAAGADVVWLAVRESRAQAAVICCAEGSRSISGLGIVIEPGVGAGGTVLQTGEPWLGEVIGDEARRLSDKEAAVPARECLKQVMVIPLRATGLRGEAHTEGIAYVGARRRVAWSRA